MRILKNSAITLYRPVNSTQSPREDPRRDDDSHGPEASEADLQLREGCIKVGGNEEESGRCNQPATGTYLKSHRL